MAIPIKSIQARVVFDSRGSETIEVDVLVEGGFGRASAPAGASTGKLEAVGFPKGGPSASVEELRSNRSKFIRADASDPYTVTRILREIDGTGNYSRVGGSAAFALSMASISAASSALNRPLYRLLERDRNLGLPLPLGNVLGGGKHAGKGSPDIQEFLSCPVGAKDVNQAIRANIEVHGEVRKEIEKRDPLFSGGKGDEGAWAPGATDQEALEIVYNSIITVSKRIGIPMRLGIDFAASTLWDEKEQAYLYRRSGLKRTAEEQLEYTLDLVDRYKPIYLEDPFHETDFESFSELTKKVKGVYIVGDDLFVTNYEIFKKGVEKHSGNAAILKVNQAGSLGDALRFGELARQSHYATITSHRSGDTCDSQIAHVAIAVGSVMIKTGSVGGERVAKLNELIRIDEENLKLNGQPMPIGKMTL